MVSTPVSRATRAVAATLAAVAGLAITAGSAQAATLTVSKVALPAGDATPFTFHVQFTALSFDRPPADFSPPGDFTLTGGQSRTFTGLHKGFYTITEQTPAGWQVVAIACGPQDPQPEDNAVVDLGAGSARLEISRTESKSCTFTDQPSAPPAVVPSPTVAPVPSAPPPPAVSVRGERRQSAAARLTAPAGCVSRRYTVAVTGGPIRSVTFLLNGRQVRTLRARRGQRRFAVRLPASAPIGRVVARVRFTAQATRRTRTLRVRVPRCARRVATPRFTG
jgi:hypothetical protein